MEGIVDTVVIYAILWLICGFGAAAIAASKNRSGAGGFFWGVLLGPIGLLIVGFMEKKAVEPAPSSTQTGNAAQSVPQGAQTKAAPAMPRERTCPWCAETIKAEAIICRFCQRDVQPLPAPEPEQGPVVKVIECESCKDMGLGSRPCPACGRVLPDGVYHCQHCKDMGGNGAPCPKCGRSEPLWIKKR